MEPEFLDPGPDQRAAAGYPFPVGVPVGPDAGQPGGRPSRPLGRRESIGLLIMLLAAAGVPLVASTGNLYSVSLRTAGFDVDFTVDAWGGTQPHDPSGSLGHPPRYGVLLTAAAAGFAVLALIAAVRLLGARTERPARVAGGIAGAAAGLVGLVIGVTAAMTLQVQSTFDGVRSTYSLVEVRLRIGDAVWLGLAAVLAGGLSVTAALRVRRAFQPTGSGY